MRVAAVPRSHPAEPRKNPPVPHGVPVVRHFPNGSLIGRARSPLGPTCGYWPFWSGSYRGQWVVRGIRAVRRHEGRRGRPLDVLVEWEGEDLWEESRVSVTELTADLRAEARQLKTDLFGPRPGSTASRRADRRAATVQRQERERGMRSSGAPT